MDPKKRRDDEVLEERKPLAPRPPDTAGPALDADAVENPADEAVRDQVAGGEQLGLGAQRQK